MTFGALTQQYMSSDSSGGGSEVQIARAEAAVQIAEQQAAVAQANLQANKEHAELIKKIAMIGAVALVAITMISRK